MKAAKQKAQIKKVLAKAEVGRLRLDDIEREIEDSDQFISLPENVNIARAEIEAYRATKKIERVNARFSAADVAMLKMIAERQGIPYQTLLGSVVHKYVTGQLVDVDSAMLALEALTKKKATG